MSSKASGKEKKSGFSKKLFRRGSVRSVGSFMNRVLKTLSTLSHFGSELHAPEGDKDDVGVHSLQERGQGIRRVGWQRLRGVSCQGQNPRSGRFEEPRQYVLHERYSAVPEQHGAVRRVSGAGAVPRRPDGRREAQDQRARAEEGRPGQRRGDRAAVGAGPSPVDLWVHAAAQPRIQSELWWHIPGNILPICCNHAWKII